MKTVSELQAEDAQALEKAQKTLNQIAQRKLALLAEIETKEIEPHHEDGERIRTWLREKLRKADGHIAFVNVACDHCNTPLIDTEPNRVLASAPPQFDAVCMGCGAHRYLRTHFRVPWTPPKE